MKGNFIETTLRGMMSAAQYASSAEQMASSRGALQSVDPRVKVAGLFSLVAATAISRQLRIIAGLFALALLLAMFSRIPLRRLAVWVWIPVLFFTGTIALPALFLTPGEAVARWRSIVIAQQGLLSAAFLLSRTETAATFTALLVLTTPWPRVLKALRTLKFPMIVVVILGMTYRYIFVILQTAFEMMESRKSRTVGVMPPAERRRLAGSSAGVLLSKSLQLSGDVHLAMQSRGFRGEVHLLEDMHTRATDWCWLVAFATVAVLAVWWHP